MIANNKAVMAGLVPAIHELDEAVVQIIPLGICRENEPYLPGSWPMLNVMFALDGRLNVGKRLRVDKPLQSVSLGEAWQQTFTVFPGTTRNLGSNAGVQDAIRPIGHYVHPRAIHRINVPQIELGATNSWMAGTSPAMTMTGRRFAITAAVVASRIGHVP
jgi:hypothetical protein